MDGQRINLHRDPVQVEKLADSLVAKNCLANRRRGNIQLRFQCAGNSDLVPVPVVDRNTVEGFPVFKTVQKLLEGPPRLTAEQRFNVVNQAFRQNFRPLFQVFSKSALLCAYLEEGKNKGYQRDTDGQRYDEPVSYANIENF